MKDVLDFLNILFLDVVWKASLSEVGDRSWAIPAGVPLDGNLLLLPVGLDLSGVLVQEIGVWVVKVLLKGHQAVLVPAGLGQTTSWVAPTSSLSHSTATISTTSSKAIGASRSTVAGSKL